MVISAVNQLPNDDEMTARNNHCLSKISAKYRIMFMTMMSFVVFRSILLVDHFEVTRASPIISKDYVANLTKLFI